MLKDSSRARPARFEWLDMKVRHIQPIHRDVVGSPFRVAEGANQVNEVPDEGRARRFKSLACRLQNGPPRATALRSDRLRNFPREHGQSVSQLGMDFL